MSPEVEAAYERLAREHEDVHVSEIQGRFFIWRPLTRNEYRSIRTMGLSEDRQEELVCATCCLWPENYDWARPEKPGFPTSLCNDILFYSGFVSWDQIKAELAAYEEELKSLDHMMDAVIAAAFPSVRPEEPGTWTMRRTLWAFSRAKWILEKIHGRPIAIYDPKTQPASPKDQHPGPDQVQQPVPVQGQEGYVPTPVDGYAPEESWWPDDMDPEDLEEIPDIEGFPEVPR